MVSLVRPDRSWQDRRQLGHPHLANSRPL